MQRFASSVAEVDDPDHGMANRGDIPGSAHGDVAAP
jgi:hypothetical protein